MAASTARETRCPDCMLVVAAQGYSMQQAPTEEDLSAALASLMVQPPSRESPPSKTPPSTFNSSATPPSTIRSGVTASPFPQSDSTAVVPPQVILDPVFSRLSESTECLLQAVVGISCFHHLFILLIWSCWVACRSIHYLGPRPDEGVLVRATDAESYKIGQMLP